jgi:hypothetical protein
MLGQRELSMCQASSLRWIVPSLPIEVEEGLGRRGAVAEAILWAEQETEIVMFAISCLLLANYESLQL